MCPPLCETILKLYSNILYEMVVKYLLLDKRFLKILMIEFSPKDAKRDRIKKISLNKNICVEVLGKWENGLGRA